MSPHTPSVAHTTSSKNKGGKVGQGSVCSQVGKHRQRANALSLAAMLLVGFTFNSFFLIHSGVMLKPQMMVLAIFRYFASEKCAMYQYFTYIQTHTNSWNRICTWVGLGAAFLWPQELCKKMSSSKLVFSWPISPLWDEWSSSSTFTKTSQTWLKGFDARGSWWICGKLLLHLHINKCDVQGQITSSLQVKIFRGKNIVS